MDILLLFGLQAFEACKLQNSVATLCILLNKLSLMHSEYNG